MKCAACDYEQPPQYEFEGLTSYPDWITLTIYVRDLADGGDVGVLHDFGRFNLTLVACPMCDTVRINRP